MVYRRTSASSTYWYFTSYDLIIDMAYTSCWPLERKQCCFIQCSVQLPFFSRVGMLNVTWAISQHCNGNLGSIEVVKNVNSFRNCRMFYQNFKIFCWWHTGELFEQFVQITVFMTSVFRSPKTKWSTQCTSSICHAKGWSLYVSLPGTF